MAKNTNLTSIEGEINKLLNFLTENIEEHKFLTFEIKAKLWGQNSVEITKNFKMEL